MEVSNEKAVAHAHTSQDRDKFLDSLPKLSDAEVPNGDLCPICLIPFSTVLEEERVGGSTAPGERLGITQLQCGHIFCMNDIAVWIHTLRGSCPTCRDLFLIIPEPTDDESSDGGEYIPGSDSVADEMMDGETWTDEEGDVWTDGEDMSLDEGITEGETDSSWGRSSESVTTDLDEVVRAPRQLGQPFVVPALVADGDDGMRSNMPHVDPECEHVKTELMHWKHRIEAIRMQGWIHKEEETRASIHDGMCALRTLKSRVESIGRDTPANVSFVHSALIAMRDLQTIIEYKLEMMHTDVAASLQESVRNV